MAQKNPKFFPARREILCGLAGFSAGLCGVVPFARAGAMDRFEKSKAPKSAPDVEYFDADDKVFKLSGLRGKVVLVNFWATWCTPCVKEMPSLDLLQAAVGKDKLVVLPLSLDGASRAKVAPFYESTGLKHLGIWFDKGRTAMKAFNVSILPTSILIDAQGREVGRLEGEADWDNRDAIALVSGAASG